MSLPPRTAMRGFKNLASLAWMTCLLLVAMLLPAAPASACAAGGCIGAGPRLASVDSGRAGLLNTVMAGLLGQSSLNLSVADWNSVATGDVSLLKTVNALQATLGVSTPAQALTTNATVAQIVGAMATAATGDGNTQLATALNNLKPGVTLSGGTVKLGDLISTDTGIGTTKINALELVTGTAQLYNRNNVVTTPSAVHVSGADIGLPGLINAIDLQLQVIEPPVFICGPVNSTFHTAAIRLRLHIDLVSVALGTGGLGVGASAQLGKLDLVIEMGRADGFIQLVDSIAGTLTAQVTPGVVAIYLGIIDPDLFFSRSYTVNYADITPAVIGAAKVLVGVSLVDVSILARAYGNGQSPTQKRLDFTGPYPQLLKAQTNTSFTTNLVTSLLSHLEITTTPSLGSVLNAVLALVVNTGLTTTLGSVLDTLVNPLLDTLGIRLGEAEIQVSGVYLSCSVSGSVYNDANHSSTLDGGEAGSGATLYAKLVASGAPGSAAITATVDPTTGAYSFPAVQTGAYSLVICATGTQTDVTPAVPAGWLATENPTFSRAITLAADLANQRFGIYHGSKLTGTVFKDTGNGGGTANNAVRDGAEAGISGATIKLTDSTGATQLDSAVTGDQGGYTLWLPFASIGAVKVTQQAGGDWVSTGGNVGTTAGAYTLATDTNAFNAASGASYTGVNFAKVPANKFDTDGQQQVLPGKVVFYTHAYTAGTAGTLSFAVSTTSVLPGFSVLVYQDANCNGQIDSGEILMPASVAVVAAQKVCVIAKVQTPVNATYGMQYPVALTATLAYSNSSITGSQQRNDITVVGDGTDGLRLVKAADKSTAATGDVITYTITYANLGTLPLSALKIVDQTPAYTVLNAATCGATGDASLTCNVTLQPGAGNAGRVEWTFTGNVASGGTGTVTFKVTLQ